MFTGKFAFSPPSTYSLLLISTGRNTGGTETLAKTALEDLLVQYRCLPITDVSGDRRKGFMQRFESWWQVTP